MKRERRSDISDLLELAQVNDAVNAPQLRQQELGQRKQQDLLSMALSLLGIQNQQQDATANRELTAKHYKDVLGEEQNRTANQSGQFWEGSLPLQYAQEERLSDAGRLSREEDVRHHTEMEDNAKKERAQAEFFAKLKALELYGTPGGNPMVGEAIKGLPEMGFLGTAEAGAKERNNKAIIDKLVPQLRAAHDPATINAFKTSYDPALVDQALGLVNTPQGVPGQPQGPTHLQNTYAQRGLLGAAPEFFGTAPENLGRGIASLPEVASAGVRKGGQVAFGEAGLDNNSDFIRNNQSKLGALTRNPNPVPLALELLLQHLFPNH